MDQSTQSLHILGRGCRWEFLWDWLGDREVFFCNKKGDVFSGSQDKMLECFELLHYVDGVVFWRLHSDAIKRGMHDVMGSFMDTTLKEDEVGVFMTHDDDNDEIADLEQWKTVPLSWWNLNKDKNNIRELCDSLI